MTPTSRAQTCFVRTGEGHVRARARARRASGSAPARPERWTHGPDTPRWWSVCVDSVCLQPFLLVVPRACVVDGAARGPGQSSSPARGLTRRWVYRLGVCTRRESFLLQALCLESNGCEREGGIQPLSSVRAATSVLSAGTRGAPRARILHASGQVTTCVPAVSQSCTPLTRGSVVGVANMAMSVVRVPVDCRPGCFWTRCVGALEQSARPYMLSQR